MKRFILLDKRILTIFFILTGRSLVTKKISKRKNPSTERHINHPHLMLQKKKRLCGTLTRKRILLIVILPIAAMSLRY